MYAITCPKCQNQVEFGQDQWEQIVTCKTCNSSLWTNRVFVRIDFGTPTVTQYGNVLSGPTVREGTPGHALTFPRQCPCCYRPADSEIVESLAKSGPASGGGHRWATKSFQIPYCSTCQAHMKAADDVERLGLGLGLTAAIAWIVAVFPLVAIFADGHVWQGIVAEAILLPVAILLTYLMLRAQRTRIEKVRAGMPSSCATEEKAISYDWGKSHFSFKNAQYAAAFRRLNQCVGVTAGY